MGKFQLEATAATYRVQYAGAGAQQAYASNLSSQLASLKAHLVKVGQELTTLDCKSWKPRVILNFKKQSLSEVRFWLKWMACLI